MVISNRVNQNSGSVIIEYLRIKTTKQVYKSVPTIKILGYNLFAGTLEFYSNGFTGVVNCINPHSHVVAVKDSVFMEALRNSDYLVADGVGIQIASIIIAGRKVEKITGSDLHRLLLESLAEKNGRCYYLGSTEAVLSKIKERAYSEFPSVQTGLYSPPYKNEFSRDETMAMINIVNDFAPDVLFVGMTAPKQEKWVHENRHLIKAPVICSIGAVFDFYAGTVKRPGKFWISLGLEWLPRLLREPGRLWRRTLISTPLFLWLVLKEKFRMLRGRERGSEEE